MPLPLTLRTVHATCRDEAPLPRELRLTCRAEDGTNGVLRAAQDAFAARGHAIGAEAIGARELLQILDRWVQHALPEPRGIACAAEGNDEQEPFASTEPGGGAILLDPATGTGPAEVWITRLAHDVVRDVAGFFASTLDGHVPDLTLAGLPLQSNARRTLVGAVPSALRSYLPWTGTHDAHVVGALGIAFAALSGSVAATALGLPAPPRSIAIASAHGRAHFGVILLERAPE